MNVYTTDDSRASDLAARRTLTRYRAFATALLLMMAGLTLASYALPTSLWSELLQAAAKAGFVGGIADWFAVTALFRHPLGLPIPHTAIIPAQKARLGRALGRFVAAHVFTEDEVARTLERLDVPAVLHRFLINPEAARPAAEALAALVPRLFAAIEDGRARRVMGRVLPRLLGGKDAGRVVGRALRQIVEGGRHQEVFGFILAQLKVALASREESLRIAIEERVRDQGGRLVGWAMGASIAKRVLSLINTEMEKMEPDGSDMRAAFDEWVRREIVRMEEDPERAAEIGTAVRKILAHPAMQAWLGDVWTRMRVSLESDAVRPGGRTVIFLTDTLMNLGRLLENDYGVRSRIQRGAETIAARLLPAAQGQLADFIASVVSGWDAATITDRLELRVGKDLQYVRINGTIVGFLVGGVVFLVLRATFGHVSF